MHALQRDLERVGCDLGEHRPGSSTDVRGIDEHAVVPRFIAGTRFIAGNSFDAHEGRRCSSTCRIRRGGDARPDAPPAVGTHPGSRVALLPAEALRTFPQARNETATTEWMPAVGVDLGFVAYAKLDWIEPTRDRHLIHGRLKREHPWTLARGAHDRRCRHI